MIRSMQLAVQVIALPLLISSTATPTPLILTAASSRNAATSLLEGRQRECYADVDTWHLVEVEEGEGSTATIGCFIN